MCFCPLSTVLICLARPGLGGLGALGRHVRRAALLRTSDAPWRAVSQYGLCPPGGAACLLCILFCCLTYAVELRAAIRFRGKLGGDRVVDLKGRLPPRSDPSDAQQVPNRIAAYILTIMPLYQMKPFDKFVTGDPPSRSVVPAALRLRVYRGPSRSECRLSYHVHHPESASQSLQGRHGRQLRRPPSSVNCPSQESEAGRACLCGSLCHNAYNS